MRPLKAWAWPSPSCLTLLAEASHVVNPEERKETCSLPVVERPARSHSKDYDTGRSRIGPQVQCTQGVARTSVLLPVCSCHFRGGWEFQSWTKESQGLGVELSLSSPGPRLESEGQGTSWEPGAGITLAP